MKKSCIIAGALIAIVGILIIGFYVHHYQYPTHGALVGGIITGFGISFLLSAAMDK